MVHGKDEVLQQDKIDTLFIAGFSGDVCVRMTTMDAFNRGYNLFWISDCIESLFEDYKKSVEYIQLASYNISYEHIRNKKTYTRPGKRLF